MWSSFRTALPTPANPGLFTLRNYTFVYSNPATYTLFLNTAVFVFVCTSIALLLAVGFAWLIERTDMPAKGTLFVLILLPSAVPSLLMGISYIILAGPEAGLLNRLTDDLFGVKLFNIFSLPAMFILQALSSVPSSFLIVLSALRSMDPALEEASSVSGVGWTSTIRRVTLPMMLPAILSAAIYTGMNIAETFEIPALIGVPIGFHVLSSQVYLSLRVWGNHTVASAYSVIFLVMLIGLVYLYQKSDPPWVSLRHHLGKRIPPQAHRHRPLALCRVDSDLLLSLCDPRIAIFCFRVVQPLSNLADAFIGLVVSRKPGQLSRSIRQRQLSRQREKYLDL